jgi:DNA-binding transcriptional ArsR family regulator
MSEEPVPRRAATAAEHRALAHPLRLQILRLCLHEERTNKELADALGRDPATVLHHVRRLVDAGFLRAGEPRRGRRGSREKPYLATRLSWSLDTAIGGDGAAVPIAVADAHAAEVRSALAADPAALVASTRLGLRLTEGRLEALRAHLEAMGEELAGADDPDGTPVSVYLHVHRRP